AIASDGWLRTGDIGRFIDDRHLKITDRKKEMFIVGGFNAYPAEIEASFLKHPSISRAAVFGVPDSRLGEVAAAFIVQKEGADEDAASMIAWARANMANFKVPRIVRIVKALPLNASGKVDKSVLRKWLEEESAGA